MPAQTKKGSRLQPVKTRPLVWAAAILCTVLVVAVIIAGLVLSVGYLILHPKLPYLGASYAHLDQFTYDQEGNLEMQMTIHVTAVNDNKKVHSTFSDLMLTLSFDGVTIAHLVAPSFDVLKNSSITLPYSFGSSPIQLEPSARDELDASLKRDKIAFILKGDARTRWKVGIIGFVKFWTRLACQLDFSVNGTRTDSSRCSSRSD